MAGNALVDWAVLRAAADEAATHARAPYSKLHVGAAGLLTNGEVIAGCNLESASYGLTLCAECGLLGHLQMLDDAELVAISVTDGSGRLLMPCGRCRQLLLEVGGRELLVDADPAPMTMRDLLPEAFTGDDLQDLD